jgi:hypothetical protein
MKSWMNKFQISNALNERKPLPPALGRAIGRSEEARRFAENASALDQALKSQLPRPGTTGSLHASIMRAVRAARHRPVAEPQRGWPRWIPVSSLVLLVLLGVFLAVRFSAHTGSTAGRADSQALAAAASALELGGDWVRGAPSVALSPLSDEMERLDRDWARTEQFLLASLP